MKRIVCDAVPFGFGPAGKLAAILRHLRDLPCRLVLLGDGTSLTLAGPLVHEVVRVNTESEEALEEVRSLVAGADLFLNVMNPVSLRMAQRLGVRTAAVDSLFWMWSEIDPSSAAADRYFIQNFVGVEERLRQERARIRHPVLVGPIVDRTATAPAQPRAAAQLLVNFGGLESAHVRRDRNLTYPYDIGELVAEALREHPFDRVVVTGHPEVMDDLRATVAIPRAEFTYLAHDRFLAELRASRVLLTSPGLTATLEACAAGVPAWFLPPQNYSQVFNLALLRRAGLARRSLAWTDLYGDSVGWRVPEEAGVRAVLALIRRFREDRAGQATLVRLVREWVALPAVELDQLAAQQAAFLAGLGEDGAAAIARHIRELLP